MLYFNQHAFESEIRWFCEGDYSQILEYYLFVLMPDLYFLIRKLFCQFYHIGFKNHCLKLLKFMLKYLLPENVYQLLALKSSFDSQ